MINSGDDVTARAKQFVNQRQLTDLVSEIKEGMTIEVNINGQWVMGQIKHVFGLLVKLSGKEKTLFSIAKIRPFGPQKTLFHANSSDRENGKNKFTLPNDWNERIDKIKNDSW